MLELPLNCGETKRCQDLALWHGGKLRSPPLVFLPLEADYPSLIPPPHSLCSSDLFFSLPTIGIVEAKLSGAIAAVASSDST
ncbi:hypothetical protein [Microcoleus sp. BROC3]|uniref:hypothetical protein n=1 Tax=Microcoleus sp. BROC3 TaxID=3055323 RepID=UPI004040A63F